VAETIEPMAPQIDQQELARELVARARAVGVQLIGEGGLLTGLTKSVLECAVEEEMSPHLGYDKHDPARPQWRQLAQRASREDGAHRDRSGEYSLRSWPPTRELLRQRQSSHLIHSGAGSRRPSPGPECARTRRTPCSRCGTCSDFPALRVRAHGGAHAWVEVVMPHADHAVAMLFDPCHGLRPRPAT
jgi:hypothetical protein